MKFKKLKKFITSAIVAAIVVGATLNTSLAGENSLLSEDAPVSVSDTVSDSFYKEEGEIDLSQYDLSLNDEGLQVSSKSSAKSNEYNFLQDLLENEELVEEYENEIENGNTLSKLGYTTVYVKEEVDLKTNTSYYTPLTESEMNSRGSGSNAKYKLTMTVTTSKNSSGYLNKVVTKAVWSSPGLTSTGPKEPAPQEDLIITTIPTVYYINKTSGSWVYRNGSNTESGNSYTYIKDSNSNPVGTKWSVVDDPLGLRTLDTATITNTIGKYKSHTKKTRHVYAEYVHTWKKVSLTVSTNIGVSKGDIGWSPTVSLGGSAAWGTDAWNIEAKVSESM